MNQDLLISCHTTSANIEFTSRCNLKCIYCSRVREDYVCKDINSEILDKLIAQLQIRRVEFVAVNGHGETTIRKDWQKYCDKFLALEIPLQITTNFSRIFSADEMATLTRFRRIVISVDCSDPILFKKIRCGADLSRPR